MESGWQFLTYLDTHCALWLCTGQVPFSALALRRIEETDLLISPAALLELQLLREIGRVQPGPNEWLAILQRDFAVTVCTLPFHRVVEESFKLSWTRDPFDRLIVAQAIAGEGRLITRDRRILGHFDGALW